MLGPMRRLAAVLIFLLISACAHDHPIGDGVHDLPLFDAHVHYKADAWQPYPPERILELMDASGVAMALVSSAPDEGTLKLYRHAPARILPEVQPYYGGYGQWNWTTSDTVIAYLRKRIADVPRVGIGEFHLHSFEEQDFPLLRAVAALAVEYGLYVHIHGDHRPVEFFYAEQPDIRVIWAHAGMVSPPDVIRDHLDRHPTLVAELSYREHEILTGDGGISPVWRDLLIDHADRFMVGSDTWANEQWERYPQLIDANRQILSQLPRDAAERIAYKNAEQVFGRPVSKDLLGTR